MRPNIYSEEDLHSDKQSLLFVMLTVLTVACFHLNEFQTSSFPKADQLLCSMEIQLKKGCFF